MSEVDIVRVRTAAQLAQALEIRLAVFVREQGVSEAVEIDGLDEAAAHLLALIGDRPVGTLRLRLLEDGQIAKIERVAVLAPYRGRQVGLALMRAGLDLAAERGAGEARLHAQTYATGFYERLGFAAFGGEFMEDGIPHIAMRRTLKDQENAAEIAP